MSVKLENFIHYIYCIFLHKFLYYHQYSIQYALSSCSLKQTDIYIFSSENLGVITVYGAEVKASVENWADLNSVRLPEGNFFC